MSGCLEAIEKTIREKKLFREKESILVAVSGGLDSMVLLALLQRLSIAHGWRLVVAHYNHQLRGAASDADEALVRRTGAALGYEVITGRGDVKQLAKQSGLSLEMAARQLRHEFLAQTAVKSGIRSVALGHHGDDQVELFFLRLLRGAGVGLAGMSVVSPSPANGNIRLVRPLLEQRRSDLAAYARGHGIEFSEDSSNACLDMQRNRIRHELVPLLEQQYQPGLRQTVLRSMELIGSEGDWVAQTARKWLGQKRRSGFDRLHVAVQRRCLQLELVRLDERPDFDLIEWLRLNPGKAISVDAEHSLERKPSGEVVRHKHSPARFESGLRHEILVGRGGELSVEEWSIAWELVSQAGKVFGRSPGCEWFDADKVGAVVFVRHWQPGDRFQPSGAACASKLQDLFTNLKVPRGQRHERLLATTRGGEIFWVEGLRIGEHFKLDNETQRRLKWEWKREKRS